jgi:hypothetical protein
MHVNVRCYVFVTYYTNQMLHAVTINKLHYLNGNKLKNRALHKYFLPKSKKPAIGGLLNYLITYSVN